MPKPTNASNGTAMHAYDPVSYFNGAPAKGDESITATHNGLTYRFASEANRDAFNADTDKYLPKYGGYCATAMSEGTIFDVDPENYKIVDGDLYLFYKGEDGDTLPEWNADEANRRAAADKHWSEDTYSEHE